MSLINLLLTVLNRGGGEPEKQPWEKGNSWLVRVGILPEFKVTQVYYTDTYNGGENISAGITDISFIITKV